MQGYIQRSKHPPVLLLPFDRLEERLEVALAEALRAYRYRGKKTLAR
jgi:hypothetical protein